MNRKVLRRERARARLLASTEYTVTEHATARAGELGYGLDEVIRCVTTPEQSYPGGSAHPRGRRVLQRRDLAVIVDEISRDVITVLPKTAAKWVHGCDTRAALFGSS